MFIVNMGNAVRRRKKAAQKEQKSAINDGMEMNANLAGFVADLNDLLTLQGKEIEALKAELTALKKESN